MLSEYKKICETAKASPGGELLEQIIQGIYCKILAPGDISIDGGSADCRHTAPMANAVGVDGLVLAVEPLYDAVYKNRPWADYYLWANVVIVQAALSNFVGKARFNYIGEDPGYSGLKKGYWPQHFTRTSIDVEVLTIDSLVQQHNLGTVKFVKLDLEGGEYPALCGATSLLKKKQTVFVFENAPGAAPENYDYLKQDLFSLALEYDHVLYDIFGKIYTSENDYCADTPQYMAMVPKYGVANQFFSEGIKDEVINIVKKSS